MDSFAVEVVGIIFAVLGAYYLGYSRGMIDARYHR